MALLEDGWYAPGPLSRPQRHPHVRDPARLVITPDRWDVRQFGRSRTCRPAGKRAGLDRWL